MKFFEKVKFINYVPRETLKKIYQDVTVGMAIFDYSPNLGYKTGAFRCK